MNASKTDQRYGCEFFRKEDGTLKSIPQRRACLTSSCIPPSSWAAAAKTWCAAS